MADVSRESYVPEEDSPRLICAGMSATYKHDDFSSRKEFKIAHPARTCGVAFGLRLLGGRFHRPLLALGLPPPNDRLGLRLGALGALARSRGGRRPLATRRRTHRALALHPSANTSARLPPRCVFAIGVCCLRRARRLLHLELLQLRQELRNLVGGHGAEVEWERSSGGGHGGSGGRSGRNVGRLRGR